MRKLVWIGIILTFLVTAATSVTLVRPGERAVVRRFGRVLDDKPEPGLYFGWPWGIDQVERIPVALKRTVQVGMSDQPVEDEDVMPAGQLLTGDHNLIDLQAEIQFTVRPQEVESYARLRGRADALVARAAESALAEWIAGRKIDDVLLAGSAQLPAFLIQRVQDLVEPYGLGVRIEQASITRLAPPGEVKEAFEKVAQAQTGIRTQEYQAQQLASRRLSDAEGEKISRERQTAAYAREQRSLAEADAKAFAIRLAQYQKLRDKDPRYLATLWLDGMTRIYAQMRVTGRIDLLDHFLTSEGLSITQFPLAPRKK